MAQTQIPLSVKPYLRQAMKREPEMTQQQIRRHRCCGWLYYDLADDWTPLGTTCPRDGERGLLCPIREVCREIWQEAGPPKPPESATGRSNGSGKVRRRIKPPRRPYADAGRVCDTVLAALLVGLGRPPVLYDAKRDFHARSTRRQAWARETVGPVFGVGLKSYHTILGELGDGKYYVLMRAWTHHGRYLRIDLLSEIATAAREIGLDLEDIPQAVRYRFPGAPSRVALASPEDAARLAAATLARLGYDLGEIAVWGERYRTAIKAGTMPAAVP